MLIRLKTEGGNLDVCPLHLAELAASGNLPDCDEGPLTLESVTSARFDAARDASACDWCSTGAVAEDFAGMVKRARDILWPDGDMDSEWSPDTLDDVARVLRPKT